jgi:O-antigen ligase
MVFILGIFAIIARGWLYVTPRIILPSLVFVLWTGLTYLWSQDIYLTASHFTTYVQLIFMLWLLWQFVDDRGLLERILQFYILGAYVLCIIALMNYSTHQAFYEDRYSAIGYDPNYFGISLALGMPLAWYLFTRAKNILSSLYAGLFFPVSLITVILTGSRGALLSTVIVCIFIFASLPRIDLARKILTAFIAVAAVWGISYYVPMEQWERFSNMFDEIIHGEASGRKQIWEAGLRVFIAHPWVGVGEGSYPYAIEALTRTFKVAHQTFLSALVETGIIGFTMFLSFLVGCLWKLRSMVKGTDKTVCMSILATWIISGCSLNLLLNKFTWFMFAIVLIIERFARAETKESSLIDVCNDDSKTEIPHLAPYNLNPVYGSRRVYSLRRILGRD